MTAEELRVQLVEAEGGLNHPIDKFADWVFGIVSEEQRIKMVNDEHTKFHAGAVNNEFKDDEELMGLFARWILEKSNDN